MGNSIKPHIERAEKTGVCQLCNSGLAEVPPQLLRLVKNLRTLDLSNNKIQSLRDTLGNFQQLKSLTVNQNRLSLLPESIGTLKKLDTLSLSQNRLTRLPETFIHLGALKTLNLSSNKLPKFPVQLFHLKHLDNVDLSDNQITEIPDGAESLHAMEINLNLNRIAVISPTLAQCPNLKVLRLEENCLNLVAIPKAIFVESKISLLALDGNTFAMKELEETDGYEKYMERFTAAKKKMF